MLLGIYGFGGHGIELEELAKVINLKEHRWEKIIFIDDTPEKVDNKKVFPFAATVSQYNTDEIEFVIGVGEPVSRELVYNKVKELDYTCAILIHPSAFVASNAQIEEGTVICYNAYISAEVCLKENTLVQPMAVVGHGCTVGKNSVISALVAMGGNSCVGNNSFIGMGVPVKHRTRIGNGTVIGIGSVVVRDIPDGVVALGNPARPMKNEGVAAIK